MRDTIYRDEAIEAVCMNDCGGCRPNECGAYLDKSCDVVKVLSALPSAETPTLTEKHQLSAETPTDIISRVDAMGAVQDHFNADGFKGYDDGQKMMDRLKALPSADAVSREDYHNLLTALNDIDRALREYQAKEEQQSAETEPTVIRSRTLMPTKDFREWAKRIKEVNPNAVVIPCDAEVASAEAVQGWIPCSERLPSAEDCPMDCMVTRRSKYVGNYTDMAVAEADGTWTHEDWKAITINGNATCISTRDADIIAWMPLPKPYKGGDNNEIG